MSNYNSNAFQNSTKKISVPQNYNHNINVNHNNIIININSSTNKETDSVEYYSEKKATGQQSIKSASLAKKVTPDKNPEINLNSNILENNNEENNFKKESNLLIDYVKSFHGKYKEYPPTSLKFYKIGRLLGRGAFGKVNLGLNILTGRLVAIKSFNISQFSNEKSKKKILYEVNLMRKLRVENVIKIFETFETNKYLIIIMEYISGGDLLSYVKKRNKLSENVAKYLFRQIVSALEYTHNQNIVHRDIKLDNILLDISNNIKICDFGVGKQIKSKKEILYDQCGTPAYIAPEILKGNGYEGPPVDYWSAGVVLYAMLSGTVPFKANDMSELQRIISSGEFTEIEGISPEANSILHGVLEVDPKKRFGPNEILNHPWFTSVEEEHAICK